MNATFSSLAEARYRDGQSSGLPLPDSLPPALETILNHKSHRAFLPQPLPPGTLEALLLSAQSGSTSSMLQTWDVITIQDPIHKAAVATLAGDQEFIRQAPLFLVFCPNLHRLANISPKYKQPAKALSSMDIFIMSSLDAAIAGQNAAIAAESLGLGMCYVGAIRNNAQQVVEILNLPPLTFAIFGMAIGYPCPGISDNPPGREEIKPRLPMREICHRETWCEDGQETNVAAFDQSLGTFYAEQGKLARKDWSEFVAGNMASGVMDGRENMRGVLRGQSYGLE